MKRGIRTSIAARFILGTLALAGATVSSLAADREAYLVGEELRATFAGSTLIGTNWAEYYTNDGTIVGRVRYLGITRDFSGRWSVNHDRVCFDYGRTEYNMCSLFRRRGDHLHHFGPDGKPKNDGISRHLNGNRLDQFK